MCWLATARPQTLVIALTAIGLGAALAALQQALDWPRLRWTFITALLLQILSNCANDYGDFLKHSDNEARVGPRRPLQLGLISPRQLRRALVLLSLACVLAGLRLLSLTPLAPGQWFAFLALGLLALLAALGYTLGTAYGYKALGDLAVFLFFGPLAVLGSFYLQAGPWPPRCWLPAIGAGLLAVAVLNLNNLRDLAQDRAAGKRTVPLLLGPRGGRHYHLLLLAAGWLAPVLYLALNGQHWPWLLLALPPLWCHGYRVLNHVEARQLRPEFPRLLALLLAVNLLFILALHL